MSDTCAAATDPDSMWGFCPSLGANIAFLAFFALTTGLHLFQGIHYRKPYTWVISMAGVWQTACYIFRLLSIQSPDSLPYYVAWVVLILVAPLCTNAFVYMVVGRVVWNFKTDPKILGVKAWNFGLFFVILDVVAFLIQVYGASSATGNDTPVDVVLRGKPPSSM